MRIGNRAVRRVVPVAAALLLATSGVAAVGAGLGLRDASAAELAPTAAIDANERYFVHFDLQDPAGGLSNAMVPVEFGKTLNQIIAENAEELKLPTAGDEVTFGDDTKHTFQGWESSISLDKPLEASDFVEYDGTFGVWVYAKWSGVSTIIFASNATDISANGKVDLACIDAWQAFCDSVGGQYPISITHSSLNAAQQQSFDTYAAGQEALAVLDFAFDEYLSDGSDGTLDVAKHDLAPSDGVTFDLRMDETALDLPADDTDLSVLRIPEEGGEPERMDVQRDGSGEIVINDMTATGTYVIARYKDVAEPWDENGKLLPYTIENGVMTFPEHPELGAWYQLTVDAEDGITFDNPGGSSAWTMTIDAAALDEDDPLFSATPGSGIYFVRGDGQGMSTNLWIEWPQDKALSYELSAGTGTVSRVGGPHTLTINLSAPSTLTLRAASETVIANEQGAMLSHTVTGAVDEAGRTDDELWSMLSLVTDWLGGDVADAAGSAINTAIAGVTKMYVYDIHLEDPLGAEFAIPEGDQVTVTLPVPADMGLENLHVFHVADDGTVTDMNATVNADAGTVSFTTSHFSTFVLANVAGSTGGTGSTADSGAPSAGGTLAETGDAALIACAGAALSGLAGAGLVGAGFKRRK